MARDVEMTSIRLQQQVAIHQQEVVEEVEYLRRRLAEGPPAGDVAELQARLRAAEEELGESAALLEDFELPEV